jgi:hypothetical protein
MCACWGAARGALRGQTWRAGRRAPGRRALTTPTVELAPHERAPPAAHPFAGAYSSTYHPDWSTLAARIVVSDLHKQTEESFSKNAVKLFTYKHPITGTPAPLIAEDVAQIIANNADRLDKAMKYDRDFE